jgi:hypothetical protein
MYKVKGRDIRDIVNREDWQKLRKSFLGTWMHTPKENVLKLRNFLGNVENAELDKLIIVYNYLTGTAFRMKKIDHPDIDKLKNEVKLELTEREKR